MFDISRRNLVAAGVAVSIPALLGRSAWAAKAVGAGHDGVPDGASAAVAPREQLLFDFDWKFRFGHGSDPTKDLKFNVGQKDFSKTGEFMFATLEYDTKSWSKVDLPHDWAVELPFVNDGDTEALDDSQRFHGFKPLGRRYPETSVGWYRREFDIPATDNGRRVWVEFDGAFREVDVFVNGCYIGHNNLGYMSFRFDITDFLFYGNKKNVIVVRVDASSGEGWWYEGAGLYRHVWLTKTDAVYFGRWESTIRPTLNGSSAALALHTVVENREAKPTTAKVVWTILDAKGTTVATAETTPQQVVPDGTTAFEASTVLANPRLWSTDEPNLYTAIATVETDGKRRDAERIEFGVRSAVFDGQKGFLLNGKQVKIQGTCNHQDHAGVGVALPDALQRYRLGVLQSMGCNAVRTSHNMPTPEWVAACDRMGVLMMCETRTLSSNDDALRQLRAMVKRYRNSPSVILWSIGNEEWHLHKEMAEQGTKIALAMAATIHELDPMRPVTGGGGFENDKGVAAAFDVPGFNYGDKFVDAFHVKYPDRPVVQSETASAISTRGEYFTDSKRNVIASYDSAVAWGENPEKWWSFAGKREWVSGGFAWTGFDYRGEPQPGMWPAISSQFGIVDTCGFPKDYYYYYKAWWRKEPSLHVFPHWDWRGKEGQEISVWAHSNLEEVELFLNGHSLGRQKVPQFGHVEWKVRYEPGVIEARGYKGGKVVLTKKRETTGAVASLRLTVDREKIAADGEDAAVINVEAFDSKGRSVPTANTKLAFKVTGAGKLIGVGNGDPNCHESDKAPKRSLFNGLCQVIVQANKRSGTIRVDVAAEEAGSSIKPASIVVRTVATKLRPAVA